MNIKKAKKLRKGDPVNHPFSINGSKALGHVLCIGIENIRMYGGKPYILVEVANLDGSTSIWPSDRLLEAE